MKISDFLENSSPATLRAIDERTLHLIVLPTEQCNFRCTYCYEDFSRGRMSDEVVLSINRYIESRSSEISKLVISWFGGEPLLAPTVIKKISSNTVGLAGLHGFHYEGQMTTNGYLLSVETLRWAISLGIRSFQVSLDGTEPLHNLTRRRADGAGTFQKIVNNLEAALQSDLQFSMILRVHFTPDNLDQTTALSEFLNRKFLCDPRFKIFFHSVNKLGGARDDLIRTFRSHAEMNHAAGRLAAEIKPSSLFSIGSDYICYASSLNSFLIRSDGKIGKCTVALNDEKNIIGEMLPDGTMKLNSEKLFQWSSGLFSNDAQMRACPNSKLQNLRYIPIRQT